MKTRTKESKVQRQTLPRCLSNPTVDAPEFGWSKPNLVRKNIVQGRSKHWQYSFIYGHVYWQLWTSFAHTYWLGMVKPKPSIKHTTTGFVSMHSEQKLRYKLKQLTPPRVAAAVALHSGHKFLSSSYA